MDPREFLAARNRDVVRSTNELSGESDGCIELLHQRYESALQEYVAARAAAGVHVVIK